MTANAWRMTGHGVVGAASACCLFIVVQLVSTRGHRDPFAGEFEKLARFEQLDAQLNRSLLEAWLLTPHYDDLNDSVTAVHNAAAQMGTPPISPTVAIDSQRLQELRATIVEKDARIESFKTHQAVLRNSSQYFPFASTQLLTFLTEPAAAPLASAILQLRSDMLAFRGTPAGLEQLRRSIDAVSALEVSASPEARKPLSRVLTQARNIVTLTPEVKQLVERALELPTTALGDEVMAHYDAHLQSAIHAARIQRGLLSAAAVGLIGLIISISLRLWRSRASLKVALAQLKVEQQFVSNQNETLEAQVKERTSELAVRNVELEQNVRLLSNTQEQLAVAGRMATVGTMAAGVAHEINNPLAFVTSNANYIVEELSQLSVWAKTAKTVLPIDLDDVLVALKDVEEGSQRVVEIVKGLKTFSHMDKRITKPIDVNRVLEFALTMAANPIRQRAELVRDLADVPDVMANEAELGQVFLNLVVNASQAFDEEQPRGKIHVTTREDASGRVCIEVRDDGRGMTDAVKARIFDPFFTTKPIGTGTGLGLSICHGIIQTCGGEIEVETAPGKGSTFRVLLPSAGRLATLDEPRVARPTPGPRTQILVIDDEVKVGEALRRTLGAEHDVVVTTEATAALALIDDGARFDLIICDLMMPVMSGADFHEALTRNHPDQALAVVFLSGGAVTRKTEEFAATQKDRFFTKPLAPAALREVVRRYSVAAVVPD